jgi:hypothetical protein
MSAGKQRPTIRQDEVAPRRPFRAVDVLSGSIDQRKAPRPERVRKQISAQLEPAQIRMLGELHARLNATAATRIEKSDLVGLGIELLAAALEDASTGLDSASEAESVGQFAGQAERDSRLGDLDDIRTYLRTYVRERDQ